MLKKTILTSSVFAVGLIASSANAAVIDFEAFSTGNLSNIETIDGVEFSVISPATDTGLRIFNDPARTAFILSCNFLSQGFNCVRDMNVDFGGLVNNVSFDFLSEDLGVGSISGTVTAYLGGAFVGAMDLISDGDSNSHNVVDLSAYGFIDQLVLTSSTDPAGLGYDNFSFGAVVPVPAAVWLFGSGLLGLVSVARRKKVS